MIDIPLGKALVPVEYLDSDFGEDDCPCEECCLSINGINQCENILCNNERKDGKNVIFKLVDYPVEEKKCKTVEQRFLYLTK